MRIKNLLLGVGLLAALSLPAVSDNVPPTDPREAPYLSHLLELTHEGEKNGEGYYSSDGHQIIFQSVRDGQPYYQIYVMNEDGSNVHRVSTGQGKTTCSYFRPDGQRIIYASTHLDPTTWPAPTPTTGPPRYQWDFDKSFDIFSARPDGTDLVRLTDAPGYDAEDAYSPDGKKIVFTSQRDGDLEIYTMDADGQHQKRMTFNPGYDGGPFYSPDGRQIIWRHFDMTGTTAQVWLMDADGTHQRPITSLVGMNWAPCFHPDNQHIVFAANLERGNFELYLIDSRGNNLQRMTFHPGFDGLPVFSPDGKHLLWTSSRDGHTHLWRADFNTDSLSHPLPIDKTHIRQDIEYLASPALGGRGSGTAENDQAAHYIADRFQRDGLQPGGGNHTFLQTFQVTTGVKAGARNRLAVGPHVLVPLRDFAPLPFSGSGRVDGPLAFAGYGLTTPHGHDDYAALDVRNKLVVVFDGLPTGNHNLNQASLRFKAINARQHGALGLLVVNGPHADPADDVSFDSDVRAGDTGLPTARVKRGALPSLPLATLEKSPRSFIMTGLQASLTVDLVRQQRPTSNVVGLLPGADDKLAPETVVIGAHFDHLGMGGIDSLSPDRHPRLHPGADDNASGTAAVMALADALAPLQGRLRRSVMLVAFSGEEIGLLGSNALVDASLHPKDGTPRKIVAMLNMDMIGRLRNNRLSVAGLGTGTGLAALVTQANASSGLQVFNGGGGFGPSDHTSFYLQGIPVLFFTTGVHADYHKPSDTADKVNYEGLEKVTDLVFNTAVRLTGLDQAPAFHRDPGAPPSLGEGRRSIRAAIGILPDYADQSNEGVRVADVMPDSPAATAGLHQGDRIVGFGDVTVHNIYDYSYALSQHAPGDMVVLTVQRQGQSLTVKVKLAARHHE